jgi:hypothetical protein
MASIFFNLSIAILGLVLVQFAYVRQLNFFTQAVIFRSSISNYLLATQTQL